MSPTTPEQLAKVLDAHKRWLNGEGGDRANLRWTDLRRTDLRWADLRWANLRGADLSEANLSEANLSEAYLRWTDLRGANLRWANLRDADLRGADLSRADLSRADLREADLSGADLREAYLSRTDLRGADIREADLIGANLSCTGVVVLVGPWSGWVDPEQATIGCQQHPHAFWRSLTKAQADRLGSGVWEQWQAWGPVVLAAIDCAARHGWPKSEEPAAAVSLEPEPAVSTTTTDA